MVEYSDAAIASHARKNAEALEAERAPLDAREVPGGLRVRGPYGKRYDAEVEGEHPIAPLPDAESGHDLDALWAADPIEYVPVRADPKNVRSGNNARAKGLTAGAGFAPIYSHRWKFE